ncbi:MAG: hypothetical protein ACLGJC_25370 [Alphaproteobacteria bacterium]
MMKLCFAMMGFGGLMAWLGFQAGADNVVFLGVLSLLAGGAAFDRMIRMG